jgi:hypothetical protein
MANPNRDERDPEGIRRANRDDEQHWSNRGWEKIEGGRSDSEPREPLGSDLTRSPFDESLLYDEQGRVRQDANVAYGEPRPEANYPRAYDRDQLINTDLNPASVLPPRTTPSFRILAVVLGIVLLALLAAALWFNFLAPVRRSPEGPTGRVQPRHVEHQNIDHQKTAATLQQVAGFVKRLNERH